MGQKPEHLYELLVALTGEDSEGIRTELDRMMKKMGLRAEELTESNVRQLLALYLDEIQIENQELSPIENGMEPNSESVQIKIEA
jgi:predicted amino acid-binding ACT domain protein